MSEPSKHPDRITAIASGLVAAFALAVSTYNVVLQRQQVRAQVWPHLEWMYSNSDGFAFLLDNSGVGPAEVRAAQVTVDGKAVRNWREALAAMHLNPELDLVNNSFNGRVFGAGAAIKPLVISNAADAKSFMSAGDVEVEICYCSVLDDCWLLHRGHSDSIRRCPVYPIPFR